MFVITALTVLVLLSSCITSLHRLSTYTTVTTEPGITGNWQYKDLQVKIESLPTSVFFKTLKAADTTNLQEKKPVFDSPEDSLLYTRSYVVGFIKNDYQFYMICSLVRLGNVLYADLEPIDVAVVESITGKDKEAAGLFSGGSYISSHSIAKVLISGNEIQFRFLNGGFISDQLNSGRLAIKYEKDDLFQTSLITSSSKDLQQFLVKYGKDERLYNKENTVTLTKI